MWAAEWQLFNQMLKKKFASLDKLLYFKEFDSLVKQISFLQRHPAAVKVQCRTWKTTDLVKNVTPSIGKWLT